MTKYCPIMSRRERAYRGEEVCLKDVCALWDEEREQCCFKTQALAAAAKPSGGSNISQQAEYVYSITPAPAVTLNSSGDWVNPNPYRIDCALERGEI